MLDFIKVWFVRLFVWPIFHYFENEKKDVVLPATPQLTAQRFKDLFVKHGVELTQIPRIYNKITLSDLSTDQALIQKLTPELIDEVAKLFAVRPEWIEGKDNRIYDHYQCYKRPKLFFELLNKVNFQHSLAPVRAITSAKKLNLLDDHSQPIVMIVVDEIARLGDETINRYFICDGEWNWSHQPCRLQLKACARIVTLKLMSVVPLKQVDYSILKKIGEGYEIPREYVDGCLCTDPSLEDYALSKKTSVVAKETEELPNVIAYIKENGLSDIQLHTKAGDESFTSKPKSDVHAKAAIAKYKPIYNLKHDCIIFWLNNQKLSNNEAAKRFYDQLPLDRQKLLTPTNGKETLSKAISEFRNREKLKTEGKLPSWLIDFNPDETK